MWQPFKKKITSAEALRKLKYSDLKLSAKYAALMDKAVNAKKANKRMAEKVFTDAAVKIAKAKLHVQKRIVYLENDVIENDVNRAIIESAEVGKIADEVMRTTDDEKLQDALETLARSSEAMSLSSQLLDSSLQDAGYDPKEIERMVEAEKNTRVMGEITPADTADRIRANVERALEESEF